MNDPLTQIRDQVDNTESEIGIKQARILMNMEQSNTINKLIEEAR